MKIDLPIPAELSKQLTDTAETMHRIEKLLQNIELMTWAQLTIDQKRDCAKTWGAR